MTTAAHQELSVSAARIRPRTGRSTRAALAAIGVIAALTATGLGASSASAGSHTVVTGHTGSGKPTMAAGDGRLYVAYAGSSGTAAAKELVFAYSTSPATQAPVLTKIANGERLPEGSGPALDDNRQTRYGSFGPGVFLAWPDGKSGNTLTAAYYNGTTLGCRTAFPGITTPFSPALAHDLSGHRYLAWTDPAGLLNVAQLSSSGCASTNTMTLVNRTTLHDVSLTGPALGWDENECCSFLGIMLGWVDRGHDLRIATYDDTPVLKNRAGVNSPVDAVGAPELISQDSDNYLAWRGANGHVFSAHSQGCSPSCFQNPDSDLPATGTGGVAAQGVWLRAWFDGTGHLVFYSPSFT